MNNSDNEASSGNVEIERKFLLRAIPENLDSYSHHVIEQAYLCTNPVVRVRRSDDDYYMTYKGKGLLERTEYNLPLTKEGYEHLLEKADGRIIHKVRYVIPLQINRQMFKSLSEEEYAKLKSRELFIELDVFSVPENLVMAEIEFPSLEAANAFVMPDFFSEDVTMDRRYHNSNMALSEG